MQSSDRKSKITQKGWFEHHSKQRSTQHTRTKIYNHDKNLQNIENKVIAAKVLVRLQNVQIDNARGNESVVETVTSNMSEITHLHSENIIRHPPLVML